MLDKRLVKKMCGARHLYQTNRDLGKEHLNGYFFVDGRYYLLTNKFYISSPEKFVGIEPAKATINTKKIISLFSIFRERNSISWLSSSPMLFDVEDLLRKGAEHISIRYRDGYKFCDAKDLWTVYNFFDFSPYMWYSQNKRGCLYLSEKWLGFSDVGMDALIKEDIV